MTTAPDPPAEAPRPRFPLHLQMAAGLVLGLTLGLAANLAAGGAPWIEAITTYVTGPIGQIFLRLLFMLVIPLLFAALVTGVAEMGDIAALRRVGLRTLAFTLLLSAISVVIALALVNAVRPGAGVDPALAGQMLEQARQGAAAIVSQSRETPGGVQAALNIIPSNVIRAAADDDILAVMVFALAFGIGLVLVQTPRTETLQHAIEGLLDVTMTLIGLVIRAAPIAVACFMFNLAALFGVELIVRLSAYVATVLAALAIQLLVVYPLLIRLTSGMGPRRFFGGVQEAMVMAFRPPRRTPPCPPRCASPRRCSTCRAASPASC